MCLFTVFVLIYQYLPAHTKKRAAYLASVLDPKSQLHAARPMDHHIFKKFCVLVEAIKKAELEREKSGNVLINATEGRLED